jgi:hypothetical protein
MPALEAELAASPIWPSKAANESWARFHRATFKGSGTVVTGTAPHSAQATAVAAHSGGTVDRVPLPSSGDYEVHEIADHRAEHVHDLSHQKKPSESVFARRLAERTCTGDRPHVWPREPPLGMSSDA